MKARSRLFSLAMTTSELLPDSPLFSQTFFISSFRRSLNIHEHTHRSCEEGCVNLHDFEVERDIIWPMSDRMYVSNAHAHVRISVSVFCERNSSAKKRKTF